MTNIKQAVFLTITFFQVLFPQLSFSSDLEKHIRNSYLVPNEIYQFAPANRNKELQRVRVFELASTIRSPDSIGYETLGFDDGLFILEFFPKRKRALKPYSQIFDDRIQKKISAVSSYLEKERTISKKSIKFQDYSQFNDGELIFYLVNYLDMPSSGFKLNEDKYVFDTQRNFLQSFVFINDEKILSPEHLVSKADPETGGYFRTLWDIFYFDGRKLILIFNRVYENHTFEVYEIKEDSIIEVLKFGFGGL